MPKITVCIPTYNRAHFLPEAIASVQAQTETDWELVICDDGSQDGTADFMRELQDQLQDDRIRYLRHETNIGKSNNMRSGYEAATGTYFIKFDDDDRLTPDFLERTSAVLDEYYQVGLVGTDHWIINEFGQRDLEQTESNSIRWKRSQLPSGTLEDLLEKVFIDQCLQIGATLWRMESLQQLDYMRRDWQNCEDNDLFVRFALANFQAYYLADRLMEYRIHPEQQGLNRAIPYLRDKIQYLQAYQFEDEAIEALRQSRLAESQLLLGLRLIEQGDTDRGRTLLKAGQSSSPKKAIAGLTLAHVPQPFRASAFALVRSIVS